MTLMNRDTPSLPRGAPPRQAIRPVVDAVCAELGIADRELARRAAVRRKVLSAWRRGPRQPLDLVSAGLDP